jgi:hypothetical protein
MELFPFKDDMSMDTDFYAPEARKLPCEMSRIVTQKGRGISRGPRGFLVKSVESLERERVEFSGSTKNCKRVRNSTKTKTAIGPANPALPPRFPRQGA